MNKTVNTLSDTELLAVNGGENNQTILRSPWGDRWSDDSYFENDKKNGLRFIGQAATYDSLKIVAAEDHNVML